MATLQLPASAQTDTQASLAAPAIGRPSCDQFPESRYALVIGNRAYIHTAPLANPINDSADVAAALTDLCFEVTLLNDIDRATFDRALRDFRRDVAQADLAVVFYAGHGIEVGGRNYLVPVDAELERDIDAEWEALDLDQVLRATATATRQVVILDACRNNPLARSMQRSVMSRGTTGLGLAPPATNDNQLVAYAASAGNTASDGAGRNSPYTRALLPHLREPGLEINILFGKVRDTVRTSTEGVQIPGFYNQLPGEPYYLNPGLSLPARQARDLAFEADSGPVLADFVDGRTVMDCDYCPALTIVRPGSYVMGAPAGEANRDEDEGPLHEVTIPDGLAVGTFEVTLREWQACAEEGGCRRRPDDESWGRFDRPVIDVNWSDAQRYVEWLSEQTGFEYRLLTEAEWEYVARAGVGAARYWEGTASTACEYANVADDAARSSGGFLWPETWTFSDCNDGFDATAPVGSFSPNGFGLHDVLGNVWEWTEDCWNDRYVQAPSDGSAWETGDCGRRVVRGGAWNTQPEQVRVAVRDGVRAGTRSNNLGFRVVRRLESEE
ncbi:MAG: SUMF1/EgtB/PvdO family nonheme iron enzyme [Rhodococcus sp.]|nr:SUMF1/EgtB/PvdO family nonheme iron enzyme [Rhodococcus sp. (in: high G+C Gram-positive bacteria)]